MIHKAFVVTISLVSFMLVSSFVSHQKGNESPLKKLNANQEDKDHNATVYLFLLDECRITQELMPEINAIYEKYSNQVQFIGVFPNFSSKPEQIEAFKIKYNINFETRTDYFKKLCKQFKIEVLPEVVIINNQNVVLYQGAINSLYVARGRRIKTQPTPYLRKAIEIAISNPGLIQKSYPAVGCAVNYTDKMY